MDKINKNKPKTVRWACMDVNGYSWTLSKNDMNYHIVLDGDIAPDGGYEAETLLEVLELAGVLDAFSY